MEGVIIAVSVVASINIYIDEHESTLVTFGLFPRGLRVISAEHTGMLHNGYHHTVDGMRGIISMNVELLRRKIQIRGSI